MKKIIIAKVMSYIKKYKDYSDTELSEIEYGLVGIYLTISKLIIISILAIILGIFKEMLIFMVFFNMIRTPAFGLHATKSWICLISSAFIFLLIPYLCSIIEIHILVKTIIGVLNTILIYNYAPADTKKRPIVNKKHRFRLKTIATAIALCFTILSLLITNNFIANCMIFSLILENFLISPITYKLFKLPYNNYIDFLKSHPDFIS